MKVPVGGVLKFATCRTPEGSKVLTMTERGALGKDVTRAFDVRECRVLRIACRLNGGATFELDGQPFTPEWKTEMGPARKRE